MFKHRHNKFLAAQMVTTIVNVLAWHIAADPLPVQDRPRADHL
jgi:hypothetical protein